MEMMPDAHSQHERELEHDDARHDWVQTIRVHIAWCRLYAEEMTERDWRDMKLRLERQLKQLDAEFERGAK